MNDPIQLVPLLVVKDAARAIDFYVEALGAKELARYLNNVLGTISHVDLRVGSGAIAVTEELRAFNSDSPASLGGSPVVLQLEVDDVEASFERMRGAGAAVVFPLQEFCGERAGRLRDPFGHLWIVKQRVEELSVEECQRRRDALFAALAASASSTAEAPSTESE